MQIKPDFAHLQQRGLIAALVARRKLASTFFADPSEGPPFMLDAFPQLSAENHIPESPQSLSSEMNDDELINDNVEETFPLSLVEPVEPSLPARSSIRRSIGRQTIRNLRRLNSRSSVRARWVR